MALTDNIIASWRFDESSGNALDASGNGHTATNSSVTYATGKINNGASFNGSAKFTVTDDATLRPSPAFSISFWVKKTGTTATEILDSYAQVSTVAGFRCVMEAGAKVSLWVGKNTGLGGSDWARVIANTSVNDGNWHHCVVTYDGTTICAYTDGSADGTTSFSATIAYDTPNNAVTIGDYVTGGAAMNGMIDELNFWSRALSLSEVTSLYNSGAGLQLTFSTNVTVSQGTPPSIVASIPSYTVSAVRNVTISQGTPPSLVASIPTYTVKTDVSIAPAVQTATFSIPTYDVIIADVLISANVQALTFSIPAYQADAIENATASPSAQALTFSIPTYSVATIANITVSVEAVVATFAIPTYRAIGDFWQNKYPSAPSSPWNDKY